MPKVYFADTGVRNILINNIQTLSQRVDKGSLVENAVVNQLQHLELPINFWRTKTKVEVDIVITLPDNNVIPIEVKYTPFKKPTIPTNLRAFIERYKPKTAFIITKDYFNETTLGTTRVFSLPAFCL